MYVAAWYVWAMVLVAVSGFALSIGYVIYRGGLEAKTVIPTAPRAGVTASMILFAGIAISAWLADAGYYADSGGSIPLIPVVFLISLIGLFSAARLPVVSRALDTPRSLIRLTLPHTFRVMGGVFLIVMAQDALPALFAVPAGVGDIAVAVAAPLVAWRLARGAGVRRAVWFNVLGLVDLIVALTIGFLTASGPLQVLVVQPSTEALTRLPLALVPTFAVPIAIALHIVSLRRLRSGSSGEGVGRPLEVRSS